TQRIASRTVVFVESPLPIRQNVLSSGRSHSSLQIPLKFKIFSCLIFIAFPYARRSDNRQFRKPNARSHASTHPLGRMHSAGNDPPYSLPTLRHPPPLG